MANANPTPSPTLISFFSEDAEAVRASQLGATAKWKYQREHPAPMDVCNSDEKYIEWEVRMRAIISPEMTLHALRDDIFQGWMRHAPRILERELTPAEIQEYPNFKEYFTQYLWENRNDNELCNVQSATAYAHSRIMEMAVKVQEIREAMLSCDNTYTPQTLYRWLYRYPSLFATPY